MEDAFGDCYALMRGQDDGFVLKLDIQCAIDYEEEFILVVVLVPMELAFVENAKPYYAVIDLAERTVVPFFLRTCVHRMGMPSWRSIFRHSPPHKAKTGLYGDPGSSVPSCVPLRVRGVVTS